MKRIKLYWVVAVLLGIGVIGNMLFSSRPMTGYSMLRIEEIATLPDTPELADVRRYTEIGSGYIPHMRVRGTPEARPPLKLGWVYQESGIMSLPYWSTDVSIGPSLYYDTGDGYQIAGVAPGQVALLEQKAGSPVLEGYRFRVWHHMWGWAYGEEPKA